jgi:hypothetical protein
LNPSLFQSELLLDFMFKVFTHFLGAMVRKDRRGAVQRDPKMAASGTMRNKNRSLPLKPFFEFAVFHGPRVVQTSLNNKVV